MWVLLEWGGGGGKRGEACLSWAVWNGSAHLMHASGSWKALLVLGCVCRGIPLGRGSSGVQLVAAGASWSFPQTGVP